MSLRPAVAAGVLAIALAVVGGCAVAPLATVEGLVVDVSAASLTDVRAFTLRTADGDRLTFDVTAFEAPPAFPLSHLREHQLLAEPVRVTYRDDGGRLVVVRLEDAA